MTTPIQHHQAGGIHPGAFVSSTPPSTIDVQDHVLWVDTSTGPPYQLKMWDQASGTWQAIIWSNRVGSADVTTGSVLIKTVQNWYALPPSKVGQVLQLAPVGSQVVPQWTESCCADMGHSVPPTIPMVAPGGTMAVPTRCGAAEVMAAYLEEYYANVETLLNAVASKAATLGIYVVAGLLAGAAPEVTAMGGLLSAGQLARLAILLLSRGLSITVCPTLNASMRSTILRAFYCALPPGPGPLLVDDAVRATWCLALTTSSVFTELAAPVLVLLSQIVSLSAWQTLANLGAQQPSAGCAVLDCGTGRGIRGSAVYGVLLRRALQGGAVYGTAQRRSITGGAHYGAKTARALQGGAVT